LNHVQPHQLHYVDARVKRHGLRCVVVRWLMLVVELPLWVM
jgi:hypothetical protein